MFSVSRNHFYSFNHAITEVDVQKAQAKGKAEADGVKTSICDQVWERIADFFSPGVKVDARKCLENLFKLQAQYATTEDGAARAKLEGEIRQAFSKLKGYATQNCKDNFVEGNGNNLMLISNDQKLDWATEPDCPTDSELPLFEITFARD